MVRAGSAADPPGKHGLADLTARLLRRGTAKLTADQIDEAVEYVGGSLFAGAQKDYLSISISAPSEHLGAMMEVLGQLVREPSFPAAEFASARGRVLAEIANELDDPGALADRALELAMYKDHPYGHEVNGRAAHLRALAREDVIDFHRERIGPAVSTLVVVGAAEPAEVATAAERAFAGWDFGPPSPPPTPKPDAIGAPGQILIVDKPEQTQAQVRIGAPGVPKGHPDYFPIAAFNAVLGLGFTSRLVTEIRVKRGLSYGAGSEVDTLAAAGTFSISSFTKTEASRQLIDVALGEVAKMRKKGPTAKELRAAQRFVTGLFPARLETNEALAAAIAELEIYGLPDDWLQRYRERFAAVAPKQAAEAAARYLFEGTPTIVVVGNAAEVSVQLEDLGSTKVMALAELE
ncbi:MAG: insulinase family protein [Myxococcales bacterium]|nr:insulinase family protein [Myxococcales bacterium]